MTIEVKETTYLGKKSGAQEVRLFRDGRLVGFKEGNILPGNDDRVQLRFESIQLPSNGPERITFSAYAFNNDRVKSETAYQTFERLFQDPKKRRAYLVAIGINETPKVPRLRLQFAANDARLLSNELKERLEQQGAYESVSVSVLISDTGHPLGATKALIKKEMETLARVVRPDDFVLVSYSGHGYASNGIFHIFPSDIVPRPSLMPAGSISTTELAEWLRGIDAEQMVLILDACHSAASVEAGGFKPGPMGDVGLGQLAYDKGMRILGASQAADVAIEDRKLKQSLLTYALVQEGLDHGKADWRPADNIIRLDEWLYYAVQRVPNLNRELETRNFKTALPRSLDLQEKSFQAPALFDFTDGMVNDVILFKASR